MILLDTSGSNTGLRQEIAKQVVLSILATLGEDDFVTVLTFSDETKPLIDCLRDENGEPKLVQVEPVDQTVFSKRFCHISGNCRQKIRVW